MGAHKKNDSLRYGDRAGLPSSVEQSPACEGSGQRRFCHYRSEVLCSRCGRDELMNAECNSSQEGGVDP